MKMKRTMATAALVVGLCTLASPAFADTTPVQPLSTQATRANPHASEIGHVTSSAGTPTVEGYFDVNNSTGKDLWLSSDVQASGMTLETSPGSKVAAGETTRIYFTAVVDYVPNEWYQWNIDASDYLVINLSDSPGGSSCPYQFNVHSFDDGQLMLYGTQGRAIQEQFPFDQHEGTFDGGPVAVLPG